MTFKSVFKKIGITTCRAILDIVQLEGRFNLTKVGLLVITFALYSILLNWKFAILLMLAIGCHESGHVWAMRKVGVHTRGFYFIPFFGGMAISSTNYKSYADRVIVFIMGPIWGMLLGLLTLVLYWITGNKMLGAAAYWQVILNLFNLLPVNPLDGGQIFRAIFGSVNKAIGNVFSAISILVFGALAFKLRSPIFTFAVVLSAIDLFMHTRTNVYDNIRKLSRTEIVIAIITYVMVTVTLLVMLGATVESGKLFAEIFLK